MIAYSPASILRPPDISDIFLEFWSENSYLDQSNISIDGHSNEKNNLDLKPISSCGDISFSNMVACQSIIPRPKVAWPSRRVTFGKPI